MLIVNPSGDSKPFNAKYPKMVKRTLKILLFVHFGTLYIKGLRVIQLGKERQQVRRNKYLKQALKGT